MNLAEMIPGLRTEIRYATAHNLTGHPLAGYLKPKAIASLEAAEALQRAFSQAKQLGYGMLVYDAYRPQKAVQDFVRWSREEENGLTRAEFYPALEKSELFPLGYIAERSGHSRGSTIDLTLTDAGGLPLDMGTCFDFMGEESHHNAPGLTPEQLATMRAAGEGVYGRSVFCYLVSSRFKGGELSGVVWVSVKVHSKYSRNDLLFPDTELRIVVRHNGRKYPMEAWEVVSVEKVV